MSKLLEAALAEDSTQEEVRSALTVLTRLARRVPTEQRWLRLALERHLAKISEDALYVGLETGSPMPEIHAQVISAAEPHERRRAVEMLRLKLPAETTNVRDLSVEVRRQVVAFLRSRKSGSEAKRHISLYEAQLSLSTTLRESGRFAEAANAAVECARHAKLAFRSSKENDRSRLAIALTNLANCLGMVGRFKEAFETSAREEEIARGLAEEKPSAYQAEWAKSLGNLGNHLTRVGRLEEALAKAKQTEALWRGLAARRPDAFTADWAQSLDNLSKNLGLVGHFEDALAKAEQAEGLRHSLAEKHPDASTQDWAYSLIGLAACLRNVGQFEEALAKAQQAELLWRGLAAKQPDAFTANWATSLNILGTSLGDVGRFEEALATHAQAEIFWRGLAEKQPDAFTASWVMSLESLCICLREAGRFGEALANAEQAEERWRGLAAKQPDALTASWATSLSNLAEAQFATGEYVAALESTKSAILQIEPFATRYPLTYIPWIGFARRVAAESYLKLQRLDEAVAEARRSTEIWVEVATLRQNYESVQAAKAFCVLMKCEIALNQNDKAIATLARAFEVLRKPLNDNPRPLKPVMLEVVDLALTINTDAVAHAVPKDLMAVVRSAPDQHR